MKSNKCSSASLQGNQRRRQRRRGRLACEERADSSQEQAVEAGAEAAGAWGMFWPPCAGGTAPSSPFFKPGPKCEMTTSH